MRDRELCLPSLCPHNTSGVLWRVNDDPYLSVSAGKVSSGRGFSRIQHIARGPNPWKSFPPFPRYSSSRIEGKKEPWYNRIIVGVRGVYAGVSKRSSRSLWSRKSPFRCPLCHQAIPFEIRRRRELCYLRVWADQRQIPGWDAYVRNWYAWWGFPSRIVNYHNLVAGRGQSLAMPIPYHHASCIRFTRRGEISIRFHEKKQRCSVCVCVSSTRVCLVTAVIRSKVWCPLSFPLLDRCSFVLPLSISGHAIHRRPVNRDCTTKGRREGGTVAIKRTGLILRFKLSGFVAYRATICCVAFRSWRETSARMQRCREFAASSILASAVNE